jgi:DNA-binding beta-propeller fold protein YncE
MLTPTPPARLGRAFNATMIVSAPIQIGVSRSLRRVGAPSPRRVPVGVSGRAAAVVAVLVSLVAVLLTPAAASAAPKGTIAVFGESGSGEGQFSAPSGIAVNQGSGQVYVVDAGNDRVQRFDEDGGFLGAFGGPGTAEGEFSFNFSFTGVAVAPDGSVYVADSGNNRVQKFTEDGTFVSMFGWDVDPSNVGVEFETCTSGCQAGLGEGAENGQLYNPIGVAINPTDGHIYVADQYNSRVQRFDASGTYMSQFSANSPQSIAVDSTGAVYVVEQFGSLLKFDPDGNQVVEFYAGSSPFSVTVDPATDNVFVAQYSYNDFSGDYEGSEVRELDADGSTIERHRSRPDTADAYGVAVRSDGGRIYVSQTFEDRVLILDDPVQTATMDPATNVESRSATLTGTVNPGGDLAVGYHFEVSADQGQTWVSFPVPDESLGGGDADIPVSEDVTGLDPSADYRARLVVTNEFGASVTSDETTFTTDAEPPDVETLAPVRIRSTSAVVAGEVNPNALETTYHFEWGETAAYGAPVPLPGASAGAGARSLTVLTELTGLEPDTLYHYRLVASNDAGVSRGADRTFRTRPAVTATSRRGYERVSPVPISGIGVGQWYNGPSKAGVVGVPAYEGERFAVRAAEGDILVEGAHAFANDLALAERTPSGWVSKSAMSRRAYGPQLFTFLNLRATNDSLSLGAYTSNSHTVTLFPEMESWDPNAVGDVLYLRRWTDPQWEVFGPTDPVQVRTGTGDTIGFGSQAVAADGSALAATTKGTRGIAGPGDPTDPAWPDLQCASASSCPLNVYLDETDGPFTDVFPGDDGKRELVNVCTAGTVLPSGPCAPPEPGRDARLISSGGASITVDGHGKPTPRNAISANGSRLFFMSPDPSTSAPDPPQLYVRQRNVDGAVVTRWISISEVAGQPDTLRGAALLEGASADGDKVFFRTTTPLTDDDPNAGCGGNPPPCTSGQPSAESWDLYMYDLPNGPDGDPATPDIDPSGGELTRISAGPAGDGDCNVRPFTLRALTDDGSRAYFTCAAPLTGAHIPDNASITGPDGTAETTEAVNLYAYDGGEPAPQRWQFVSRLPTARDAGGTPLGECATRGTGANGPLVGDNNAVLHTQLGTCVSVSADGSLLTFFTDGRLTGDDPDQVSGDMYGYDLEAGQLTRLSAPQGGGGGDYVCAPPAGTIVCHGDPGITGFDEAMPKLNATLSPDGDAVAFFESRSRLVAEDTDDAYDVYQWRDGELSLLSTGGSDPVDGIFFAGAERNGRNVYLATRDQLTWEDKDRVLDVYTARVGGGFTEPMTPPVCAALIDACQGAGAGAPAPALAETRTPVPAGEGDAVSPPRATVRLKRLTKAQRKALVADRTVNLRVTVNRPGKVTLTGKARVGKRVRRVLSASETTLAAGPVKLSVRLTAPARRQLAKTRRLSISLRVAFSETSHALTRSVRLTKPKPRR